ncbi:hypothetical protein A2662_00860 [Candidatus Giovannonibacteria bacterium RIFCSPHIGHO2_01_FULL_45_33]|uniref:Uncharacterized protein n=1 Tax=Candidatus Giovannonibacteria bacterium RIFCSPLOWO2_01_FULL_45_34 TaxID=1798351 RepID=A0A1F5WXZ5_9BACT|nr:MAG: hypothetical protein A2662_00860 [Candidatus Giovannonibacteria bacterium RIFCSPHIGHO2_01_FULL_45_33]OGF70863.1 MAG: hypothetical protein A3C73_02190 [Candidatus Giovannonibacteria bacterium RIFCSPHIGHO2_02_FULL_44_11]OGF80526.1 MAG: hypothetical protein A2930_02755 [Candidatus Giovannonibacteria bacterium RIFCSPLOWO2_01_FULL_45_34]
MLPEENKNDTLPNIRTFKTDASSYVQQNKVSDLEIAAKSYVAQTTGQREKSTQINHKKTIFIAGGIAVLAIAGFMGYAYINGGLTRPEPVTADPKAPPKFVQTESETEIIFLSADRGSLINAIKNELGKQLQYGTANYLRIKSGSNYIDSKTFIAALGWEAQKDFIEALEPDFNALITYQSPASPAGGPASAPVFIFKTKNFTKSFAALLAWEPTMWQDMKPFLDLQNIDVATFYQKAFIDDSIKNNDARAFTATDGRTIFEYAFFSKKFIIISTSRDALGLILERLLTLPPQ